MHVYMYLYIMSSSSFLIATFAKESMLGTRSWKNEHGNLKVKVKTTTFLRMAAQAKPLCSRGLQQSLVQNHGLPSQISLTMTPKPWESV